MLKRKIGVVLLVALIAVGLVFINLPYAEAHYGGHHGGGTGTETATGSWHGGGHGGHHGGGTGTGTATGSWHGGGHGGHHGGCHGGCTGTETATGSWHGGGHWGHHGGGWNGGGHHWSYAGTVTASLAEVLAQWSGFTADDIMNVVQAYELNVAQTINTVVLAKVAGIGLDEAAQIVASGELATYLSENGLTNMFAQARKDFGMNYMHQWMHGQAGGHAQAHAGGSPHGHGMAAIGEDIIISTLAQWSGFSADEITAIENQYGFVDARLINVVVLAKVAGIGLDEAAQIVVSGNLAIYLYDNGLIDAFRSARHEVMVMLGFGGGAGTGSGTGTTTASTATP